MNNHTADEVRAYIKLMLENGWSESTPFMALLEAYADLLALRADPDGSTVPDDSEITVQQRNGYTRLYYNDVIISIAERGTNADNLTAVADLFRTLNQRLAQATRDKEAAEQRILDEVDKCSDELQRVSAMLEAAERERDDACDQLRLIAEDRELIRTERDNLTDKLQAAEERIAELEAELADEENDRNKRFLYRAQD